MVKLGDATLTSQGQISIPKKIRKSLDAITKEEGLSRSEVVRECLRDYLVVRRFRALRRKMIPHAQKQGIYTDEDVFKLVS